MMLRDRGPTHLQNGHHNGLQNGEPLGRQQGRGIFKRVLAWVDSKIFLCNVTFGLYMLDWWERVLFNVLALLLIWFLCYTASDFLICSFSKRENAFQDWKPLSFMRGVVFSDG